MNSRDLIETNIAISILWDIIKDGRNLSEMAVNNDIEYAAQGRPGIGSLVNGLSSRDILQTKCM